MTDYLCCVLPFVCLLGGVGLFVLIWRLGAMRGFEASVAMDGATCLRAQDGSLVFRRQTVRNWVYLAFLSLAELGMAALFLATLRNLFLREWNLVDSLDSLGISVAGGGLLGGAIFVLVRRLATQQASLDANARVVRVGRGKSRHETPFSDIARVTVRVIQRSGMEAPETGVIEIGTVLENGRRLPLGTVSGKAKAATERATTIARWIGELTGAQPEQPVW